MKNIKVGEKTMTVGIYKIINKGNGKIYIGQSRDVEKRIREHKYELRKNCHHNVHLQKSFNKYGEENFEFIVLKECEPEELNDLEVYYIKKYDTFENRDKGYNLDSGGSVPEVSEETKAKMSEAKLGKLFSEERKIEMSRAKNSTGFFNVSKKIEKGCKQGFLWRYSYTEDRRRKEICSVDIFKLKSKVISRGLHWENYKQI